MPDFEHDYEKSIVLQDENDPMVWWLVNENAVTQLKAITLGNAIREAKSIDPDVSTKLYIDSNNCSQKVLFYI